MDKKRSYDEGCAAAHALDLVGERWALLVVRELLLGPKRFTDLRDGMPGVSPNVLAQRLRDLEKVGVVTKHRLPPPAASQVYELSDWGKELEPVIMALGRWGVRSPYMPFTAPTSATAMVVALETMFDPEAAEGFAGHFELRFGDDHFRAEVEEGRLEFSRLPAPVSPPADAVIVSDTDTFKGLAFNGLPTQTAIEMGALELTGDRDRAEHFFSLFPLPEPLEAPTV